MGGKRAKRPNNIRKKNNPHNSNESGEAHSQRNKKKMIIEDFQKEKVVLMKKEKGYCKIPTPKEGGKKQVA